MKTARRNFWLKTLKCKNKRAAIANTRHLCNYFFDSQLIIQLKHLNNSTSSNIKSSMLSGYTNILSTYSRHFKGLTLAFYWN